MRLWYHWCFLLFAGLLSYMSMRVWPRVSDLNQDLSEVEIEVQQKEDIISILLFKPFHYLMSVLLFIFFLMVMIHLVKKVVYEWKVSFLLKTFPYEPLLLSVLALFIFIRAIVYFPIMGSIVTVTVLLYEFGISLSQRKSEKVYVREEY